MTPVFSKAHPMSSEHERRFVGQRRGQLIFALGFVGCAALLLALIGDQTRWVDKTKLFAQPCSGLQSVWGAWC